MIGRYGKHYINVHAWIKRKRGKPQQCEINSAHTSRPIAWANISREYLFEEQDWIRLCVSCHAVFDMHKMSVPQLKERDKKRQVLAEKLEKEILPNFVSSYRKLPKRLPKLKRMYSLTRRYAKQGKITTLSPKRYTPRITFPKSFISEPPTAEEKLHFLYLLELEGEY